jgi:hypothetical protein
MFFTLPLALIDKNRLQLFANPHKIRIYLFQCPPKHKHPDWLNPVRAQKKKRLFPKNN